MGTSKSTQFTKEQNRLADLYKAMAHPARIAILQLLINKSSCICGDIVDELPLSQSTISQHLKELKKAGIIKGEISGVRTCYCIDDKVWKEMEEVNSLMMSSYSEKNKCC